MNCPLCNSERVHDNKYYPNENWALRCDGCGAELINGTWTKQCKKCHKNVDELYGMFVPHLCKECMDKALENDRKTGNICSMCRLPRSACCC